MFIGNASFSVTPASELERRCLAILAQEDLSLRAFLFNDNSGATVLTFKLTQSHVSDGFLMLVSISIELGDGHVARLGRIGIDGNTNPEAAGAAAHSAA